MRALMVAMALLAVQAPDQFVARVSDESAIRPAEASIAINPANRDHIVAVSLQAMKPGSPVRLSNFSYTSIDGGRTWRTVAASNAHQRVHGDDAVTIGRDGTIYHSYIAFDGIRAPRPDRASSGIYIRTSRDGISWNEPVAVIDHLNTAIPFEDKPWVGVDDADESPHRGNVYVAWTRFDVYGSDNPDHKSHIWFARSRDVYASGAGVGCAGRCQRQRRHRGRRGAVGRHQGRGVRGVGGSERPRLRSIARWRLHIRRGHDRRRHAGRMGHPAAGHHAS
jgi:hypothetical protein